jgi:hypothetical protein
MPASEAMRAIGSDLFLSHRANIEGLVAFYAKVCYYWCALKTPYQSETAKRLQRPAVSNPSNGGPNDELL